MRADKYLQNSTMRTVPTVSLKQSLKKAYEHKRNWENIMFIRKKRLIPFTSEIRRFMLALESKKQSGTISLFLTQEIRFSLNSLLLYSCCKSMPFCLENYIPLFKGLVDYFDFIKKRLEFTRAYIRQTRTRPEPSYMIESRGLPSVVYDFSPKEKPSKVEPRQPKTTYTKQLRKSRYSSRNALNSEFGSHLRSSRTHLLLKHERYQDQTHKSDMIIIKKLTPEQKNQLKLHEEYVRLEEEKQLKLVDGSVIKQCKMIMTIIRNLIGSSFNEKIVYNDKKLLNILYDILLFNNDSELDKLALENFAVISR